MDPEMGFAPGSNRNLEGEAHEEVNSRAHNCVGLNSATAANFC